LRRSIAVSLPVALSLAGALLFLSACAPSGPTWVDSGATYTTPTLTAVYAKADISKLVGSSASDTKEQRHNALTGLRKHGGLASKAADLITKTLPPNSRGVPVYVERATIDGQHGLILVEAIGPPNGKLTTKQLWVLSDVGAVLFVGTRNSQQSTSTL
jgi:hypothetical protein